MFQLSHNNSIEVRPGYSLPWYIYIYASSAKRARWTPEVSEGSFIHGKGQYGALW
jgi:hypothetical protein